MLEAIRNRSNGPIAKFIIGLIIVPFAFAGVYSYFNVNTSNSVATVNGEDISLTEFNRSYQAQQQRWGDNFDTYFNTDERLQQFRLTVLQQVINQRLSSLAIDDMGLRISDVKLRKLITSNADYQDENGKFDEDRYNLILRSRGYSPQQFQAIRKSDLASNQFIQTLQGSNFVLKNELDLNVRLQNQTRDINYLVIPQDYYATQVDLTGDEGEAAINSYYDLNNNRFSIAEKVSVEYLYITRRDSTKVVISDGQIADFYNENLANYETNERRHLSHILVNITADADQATLDAAQLKINNIAARLQAGAIFEELAASDSEDTSTAEFGGDLDWIEIGMMDSAFEEAAFNLDETNNVSSIVKTGFGFHIIKLLEIEKGGAQPIAEVKEQIVTTLQSEFVDNNFLDAKDNISEKAFEISDSLVEAAEVGGLVVLTTPLFDGQFGNGLPAELRNQPNILDSAFSDDVLYQGLNSELIELTDGNAVILRLLKHQESGISALADVKEQVISILTNERIREATESAGNKVIAALREDKTAQEALAGIPEDLPVSWQQQLGLTRMGTEVDAELRNEVFRIPTPTTEKSVYKGVLLASGNYAVISLNTVNEGINVNDENTESKLVELDKKFNDYYLQADIYHYLKYLDENATISRTISNIDFVQ
ncbi:MAG: peptidyl-prolyl cis-trans isomerase D [Enterobacterales bacterium]|jgi:peptidyl-prolyl cis-trans isomerase D